MRARIHIQQGVFFFYLLAIAALLPGCMAADRGAVLFDIDLAPLSAAYGTAKVDPPPITAVTVTLSRDGFDTIVQDLTVSDGHATGTVVDLLEGYWHVKVDVYSDSTKIYTGEKDVNVIAGLVVRVSILFDPVIEEPHTGGISFDVGLNPVPGFRALDQLADATMFSAARSEVYLYDGTQCLIGVYDAVSLNRVRDIEVPQAPHSLCLGADENEFVLGYTSGQVYTLAVDSGDFALAGDVLMDVRMLAGIAPDYVLAIGPGTYDSLVKTLNLATGQIVATQSVFYSFQDLVYNAAVETAYAYTTGVSPADLYRFKLDPATGAILEADDSRYHGDYSFGGPLRLIREGQRIATSSGNMFTCAPLADTDLTYAGNLGLTYTDMAADDALGYLYLVKPAVGETDAKLIILRQDSFFVVATVDLPGTPKRVVNTADDVIVTIEYNAQLFGKAFSKSSLGL